MLNKGKIVEICINETVYGGLNFLWVHVPLQAINSIQLHESFITEVRYMFIKS